MTFMIGGELKTDLLFPLQHQIGEEVERLISSGMSGLDAVVQIGQKYGTISTAEAETLRLCSGREFDLMAKAQGWS